MNATNMAMRTMRKASGKCCAGRERVLVPTQVCDTRRIERKTTRTRTTVQAVRCARVSQPQGLRQRCGGEGHLRFRRVVAFAGEANYDDLQKEIGGTAIYLVGMMGSGKSTVGKLLAEQLSYRFFDTDDVIEKSLGATVSQIFEENGEEVFRDIETKVLQELSQYARSVISTGGGAVLSTENWGNMRHGIVVWLNGSPKTLASRIHGVEKENRPLLNEVEESQEELVAKLSGMLEEREKFYNEADIVVELEDDQSGQIFDPETLRLKIMERLAKAIQEKKQDVRSEAYEMV